MRRRLTADPLLHHAEDLGLRGGLVDHDPEILQPAALAHEGERQEAGGILEAEILRHREIRGDLHGLGRLADVLGDRQELDERRPHLVVGVGQVGAGLDGLLDLGGVDPATLHVVGDGNVELPQGRLLIQTRLDHRADHVGDLCDRPGQHVPRADPRADPDALDRALEALRRGEPGQLRLEGVNVVEPGDLGEDVDDDAVCHQVSPCVRSRRMLRS